MFGGRIALLTLLVFAQAEAPPPGSDLLNLDLNATPPGAGLGLGTPDGVDDSMPNFVSWLFKRGAEDLHNYGYVLCLRRSDRKLVSVTRNLEPEATVDHLFPEGSFSVHHWPSADRPQFSVRVRALSGNRLLMAMGSGAEGKPCGQLVLIDRGAIPIFFPWIDVR